MSVHLKFTHQVGKKKEITEKWEKIHLGKIQGNRSPIFYQQHVGMLKENNMP